MSVPQALCYQYLQGPYERPTSLTQCSVRLTLRRYWVSADGVQAHSAERALATSGDSTAKSGSNMSRLSPGAATIIPGRLHDFDA